MLRLNFAIKLGLTSGLENGQTVMQIPQPAVSLKNGKHLSKSTYHFFSPLTVFFSCKIASGGQNFEQIWHLRQKSSTPKLFGSSWF